MNPLHSSKSDEWYTPTYIIERVRAVLGSIGFDPASCALANKLVGAQTYCSLEGPSGLDVAWLEAWFCNPPYSKAAGGVGRWIQKATESPSCGIMLVNATPDRGWFKTIWEQADAVCFLYKRIRFMRADETGALEYGPSPTHGSCLVLFSTGAHMNDRFTSTLADLGHTIILS